MALALGGDKTARKLFLLFSCREIGEGDIELCALHIHIYPDEPLLLGQLRTGIHGVIKKVAQDAAEVKLTHFQFDRDMGIDLHRDISALGKGYLAVDDGISHGVAGFYSQINSVQVGIQCIQVGFDAVQIPLCRQHLHGLDVSPVIVPPSPHLAVHVVHLFVVGLDELPLVSGDAFIEEL